MTTIDKSKQLSVSLNLVNDEFHFMGTTESNAPISIDYIPPLGDTLDLVLISSHVTEAEFEKVIGLADVNIL